MSWAEVKALRDSLSRIGYTEQTISRVNTRPELILANMPVKNATASCIYKDKIHILAPNIHYIFDGEKWELQADTPPSTRSAVEYNGRLLLASSGVKVLNDGNWEVFATYPTDYGHSHRLVVYKDELYGFFGNSNDSAYLFKWNGNAFVLVDSTAIAMYGNGYSSITVGDKIYVVTYNRIYIYDGISWQTITHSYDLRDSSCFIYDDNLCTVKGNTLYLYNGSEWKTYNTGMGTGNSYLDLVYNGTPHLLGNTTNTAHYTATTLLNGDIIFNYTGASAKQYLPEETRVFCDKDRTRVVPISGECVEIPEGYKITKSGIVTINEIDVDGQYYALV